MKPLPENSSGSQDPGVGVNKEDDTLSFPEVINGAEYLDIDHDAPCFPEDNHLEEDTVEAVVNERSSADGNDDLDDDSDQEQTVEQTVTHSQKCRSSTGSLLHRTGI